MYRASGLYLELDKLARFTSPKVRLLLDLLRKSNAELSVQCGGGGDYGHGSNLSTTVTSLVFVKMRQTAAVLAEIIRKSAQLAVDEAELARARQSETTYTSH